MKIKKSGRRRMKSKKSVGRVKKIAGCKENRALLDFSCIFNVTFPLEFYLKFNSLSNALYFRALAPILTELWPFSHDNFLKHDFFGFFSSCRPPYKSQIIEISQFYCLYSKVWMCTFRKLQKIVPGYLLWYSK